MSVGWGQSCIEGEEVEIWGECFSIDETTSLGTALLLENENAKSNNM